MTAATYQIPTNRKAEQKYYRHQLQAENLRKKQHETLLNEITEFLKNN